MNLIKQFKEMEKKMKVGDKIKGLMKENYVTNGIVYAAKSTVRGVYFGNYLKIQNSRFTSLIPLSKINISDI